MFGARAALCLVAAFVLPALACYSQRSHTPRSSRVDASIAGASEPSPPIADSGSPAAIDAADPPTKTSACTSSCATGMRCCRGCTQEVCVSNDRDCPKFACRSCEPQPAAASGDCMAQLGIHWDGQACRALEGCTCEGPGCAELFPDWYECRRALQLAGCLPLDCSISGCPRGEACEQCWSSMLCGPPGFATSC